MTLIAVLPTPSLRLVVQTLAVVCIACIGLGAVSLFRILQDATISDTAARGFGPRMVQVVDSYAYDIPQTDPNEDLHWYVLTGNTLSQPTRRGWSDTLFRLHADGRQQTFVRVSLAATGIDPNFELSGDLATQLTQLSRRITALKSDATLRIKLRDNRWVEFSSPAHWRARPTHVQLGLAVLALLGTLFGLIHLISTQLSDRFSLLTRFAQSLLDHRPQEPLAISGVSEARQLAHALNDIHTDLGRQIQIRTRFLAAISHDLRTPTTRMKLRAELIDDDVLRGKMLSDLDEINDMIGAALSFLRDGLEDSPSETVLFVSLMQSLCDDYIDIGKPVSLSLPDPLVATTQGTVFDPRPGQFDVQIDRQITLICQPSRLRRCFANIIDNALKYGDWARIGIQADAETITVCVVDGGPGLDDDQIAMVFEPFYRVEGSRSRATGGVGLGLSVSKSIIEAHGGSIELFNHDGHGLEVRVTLPRTP